jgi:hypothetical protein
LFALEHIEDLGQARILIAAHGGINHVVGNDARTRASTSMTAPPALPPPPYDAPDYHTPGEHVVIVVAPDARFKISEDMDELLSLGARAPDVCVLPLP